MVHTMSGQTIVVAAEGQVSCDLVDEAAILDLKSGVYFALNAVGARIWKLIQEPKTVNEVRDALLEEYDVDLERCEQELVVLLQGLVAHGLIESKNGSAL
jgi:Coenzyme PQQ synthesis protein D (PqqD)